MASTTTEMGLKLWNAPGDFFSYAELASNFQKINDHDHTSGKGVALGANSVGLSQIQDNAVTNAKLADLSVGTAELIAASVTSSKLKPTMGTVGSTGTVTITSSFQDIPGGAVNVNNIYTYNTLIIAYPYVWHGTASQGDTVVEIGLNVGGVIQSGSCLVHPKSYATTPGPPVSTAYAWYVTGQTGSVLFKLQARHFTGWGAGVNGVTTGLYPSAAASTRFLYLVHAA